MDRCKYLYLCPRGFRNEFSVYRVQPGIARNGRDMMEMAAEWAEQMGAEWITRREAERLVARERANLRVNRQAGVNDHTNPVGATSIEDWWMESGQTYWMEGEK